MATYLAALPNPGEFHLRVHILNCLYCQSLFLHAKYLISSLFLDQKEARAGGKGLRTGREQIYGELFLSANFCIIDFRVMLYLPCISDDIQIASLIIWVHIVIYLNYCRMRMLVTQDPMVIQLALL